MPTRTKQPLQVLMIEDDQDTAALMQRWLVELGHASKSEVDGPAGLRAALEGSFDTVLVDIGLPGLDGYQIVRAIRERHGRTPNVVAITGYTSPADVAKALEAGFDTYIAKPLNLPALKRALDSKRPTA